ncbi:hypothetical protein HanIR_Chr08g0351861 [Helianthus annuus]|nr:hypothetical protein HanIR_Chr08g0351861 [Helianthus annuus]
MFKVLFHTGAKYQDIVEINHHTMPDKGFKYLVHKPHERAGGIGKAKRHDHPLVKPITRFKCCFPLVPRSHPNLVIPATKIDFREN